jgi:hypothetical protein
MDGSIWFEDVFRPNDMFCDQRGYIQGCMGIYCSIGCYDDWLTVERKGWRAANIVYYKSEIRRLESKLRELGEEP